MGMGFSSILLTKSKEYSSGPHMFSSWACPEHPLVLPYPLGIVDETINGCAVHAEPKGQQGDTLSHLESWAFQSLPQHH